MDEKRALKALYNTTLTRLNKAEKYIDDKSIPEEKRDKWMPEFLKIAQQLNVMLMEIGDYTEDEAVNGFKELIK